MYGIAGAQEAAAPREITPELGDSFTFFEKWLDLAPDGSVRETVYQPGATFLFGPQAFTWEQ